MYVYIRIVIFFGSCLPWQLYGSLSLATCFCCALSTRVSQLVNKKCSPILFCWFLTNSSAVLIALALPRYQSKANVQEMMVEQAAVVGILTLAVKFVIAKATNFQDDVGFRGFLIVVMLSF
jgi:hypothetical protein